MSNALMIEPRSRSLQRLPFSFDAVFVQPVAVKTKPNSHTRCGSQLGRATRAPAPSSVLHGGGHSTHTQKTTVPKAPKSLFGTLMEVGRLVSGG